VVLLNIEFYMKGPAGTRDFDLPDDVPKEISPASIEVLSEQQFRGKII
jgi:hypothetical protein